MHRISRDRLYYQLVSDIKFERKISGPLKDAQIYEMIDRFCDHVCSRTTMVVQASIEGFGQSVHGQFGKDEPWPEWVMREDLIAEGLVDAPKAEG